MRPAEPIRLADYAPNGWQRWIDACPEHGRDCGPWCPVLWPAPSELIVRRAVDMPTARLLRAVREVGSDD